MTECASHTTVRTGLVYGGSPSISIPLFSPKYLLPLFKIRLDWDKPKSFLIELQTNMTFSPSQICETSAFIAAHYPLVLWLLLTSCLNQPVVDKISAGKVNILQPNPAESTCLSFWYSLGFTMMCLLTQINMPRIPFLFVSSGLCSLAYFRPNLTVSNLATYYASRRYPSA